MIYPPANCAVRVTHRPSKTVEMREGPSVFKCRQECLSALEKQLGKLDLKDLQIDTYRPSSITGQ